MIQLNAAQESVPSGEEQEEFVKEYVNANELSNAVSLGEAIAFLTSKS
jgi:hypothetical protein